MISPDCHSSTQQYNGQVGGLSTAGRQRSHQARERCAGATLHHRVRSRDCCHFAGSLGLEDRGVPRNHFCGGSSDPGGRARSKKPISSLARHPGQSRSAAASVTASVFLVWGHHGSGRSEADSRGFGPSALRREGPKRLAMGQARRGGARPVASIGSEADRGVRRVSERLMSSYRLRRDHVRSEQDCCGDTRL
jgi:hypothetical protein